MSEDPVHDAIIRTIELFRDQGKTIAVVVACAALIGFGVYFLTQYLDTREAQAQQELAKGIDFFHADIDPAALDDPYGKGAYPLFRTEAAKYQATAKELQTTLSKYGSSKVGVIARYYLALVQIRQGQKKEALQNLEAVGNNSKDRTVAYLAKKVLARQYAEAGNNKGAQQLLESIIRDPQCDLPKEDLSIELSRILVAQGKRDEAIKVLRDAREQVPSSMLQQQVVQELTKLQTSPGG